MSYKYNTKFCTEAVYYLGHPDRNTLYGLAEHLGVAFVTIKVWQREYKDFDEAVKKGLKLRDLLNVGVIKYKPSMCKRVKKLMSEGKTKASVCANLGISYKTLQAWRADYPAFEEAFELGQLLLQEHWEKIGYEGMLGKIEGFNQAVWNLTVKSKFGYSDKTEISGNPEAPLLTGITVEFVNNSDDDSDDE
jgi:hypothetical protein